LAAAVAADFDVVLSMSTLRRLRMVLTNYCRCLLHLWQQEVLMERS
jgi:hypothetical protein